MPMRRLLACSLLLAAIACDSSGNGSDAAIPHPDAGHDDSGVEPGDGGAHADAEPPVVQCEVVAPTSCVEPAPRYADVEPIFERRCIGCHFGMAGGPWPLTSYPHIASWFAEIRAAMLTCAMPPPDSGMTMPDSERDVILAWLRCGYPL
jgi:hypothetical protein